MEPVENKTEKDACKIVNLLLRCPHINVNHKDCDGETPLIYACKTEQVSIVGCLLRCPAIDLNIKSRRNSSALIEACCYHSNYHILNLLLQCPQLNVNQVCQHGFTALMMVVTEGYRSPTIVKQLLQHPAIAVNMQNTLGETALLIACKRQDTTIIKLLLHHPDTRIDIADFQGRTPLWLARKTRAQQVVTLLRAHEQKKRAHMEALVQPRSYIPVRTPAPARCRAERHQNSRPEQLQLSDAELAPLVQGLQQQQQLMQKQYTVLRTSQVRQDKILHLLSTYLAKKKERLERHTHSRKRRNRSVMSTTEQKEQKEHAASVSESESGLNPNALAKVTKIAAA